MTYFKRKKNTARSDKDLLPIIIGGCYRSGTTLLRRILDSHSNIHCPPEVKFFRDLYGYYLNDDLKNLRFFSTARQMGLETKELLIIFGKSFIKCHELAAKKSGKIRWADKNPENLLYLDEWMKLMDGKFNFILIVRNPLDTIASMKEMKFPKTLPSNFEEQVELYKKYTVAGIKFAQSHEAMSCIVRYEDLVTEPEKVVKDINIFIGEKYEDSMLTAFNDSLRKKGIEDPKILLTKSIHSTSIGRWKNDLSNSEIDYISKRCKKIFKKFNYDIP